MENTLVYPKSRWLVLVTAFVCFVSVGTYVIMLAPIVGLIADEFGLSPGQVSFYGMGLFTIVSSITIIAACGPLYDRFGVKPVLTVGVIGVLVITLMLPLFTQSMTGIIVFRVLLGIFAAPPSSFMVKLAAEWFPPRERGLFCGIVGAGLSAGITISLMILGFNLGATHGDWRASLNALIPIPIIAAVIVIVWLIVTKKTILPEEKLIGGQEGVAKSIFASVLKAPAFYLTILGFVCYTWCLNSFTDLAPGFIAIDPPTGLGLGAETASFMSMLISIGNIAGGVFAGFVVDKILKGRVGPIVIAAFAIEAISVFLVRFHFINGSPAVLMIILFLAGFAVTAASTSLTTYVTLRFPFAVNGKVYAIAFGVGLLVGSAGVSICSGILHVTGGYMVPFLLIAIAAAVGLVPSVLLEKVKILKGDAPKESAS